jgi:hypothetical protein
MLRLVYTLLSGKRMLLNVALISYICRGVNIDDSAK